MPDRFIKFAAFLALVSVTVACSFLSGAPTPTAAEIELKEQEVYAFFLDDAGDVPLILQDISTQNPGQSRQDIKSNVRGASNETVDNFLERNAQPGQLSPEMQFDKEYILLKPDELSALASQSNWGVALREKYPNSNGYLYFSRVGLNSELDQALIYVGQVFGPLACTGDYYLLEINNGEWLLMDQVNMIIC